MTLSKKSMMMVASAMAASIALVGVGVVSMKENKNFSINATTTSEYSLTVTAANVPTSAGSAVEETINGNIWTFTGVWASNGKIAFNANGFIKSCVFPQGWTKVTFATIDGDASVYCSCFNNANGEGSASDVASGKDYIPNTSSHNYYFTITNKNSSIVYIFSFTVTYNCVR